MICSYNILAKHPPSAGFLSPAGGTAPSAAVKEKSFRRVIKILNMCLVLKLDNGKVVSIANEQTDRQTESHSYPVPMDGCVLFPV